MASSSFIIRIRHRSGTTRIGLVNDSQTSIGELKQLISEQLATKPPISSQQLTSSGLPNDTIFQNDVSLSSLNLSHGAMVYLKIVAIPHHGLTTNTNTTNTNTNTDNPKTESNKRKLDEMSSSKSKPVPPKKKPKNNPPKTFEIHTIHNTGVNMIGGIGDNNDININVNQLKPPKTKNPQFKLIDLSKKCTKNQRKFIMYLIIIIAAYDGFKLSFELIDEPNRIEEVLNKLLNKTAWQISQMRFMAKYICFIMEQYKKSWNICTKYIVKFAATTSIKNGNDLIIEPSQHSSLSLILLTILCGGQTRTVNLVQEISDSGIDELEHEWNITYDNYMSQNIQIPMSMSHVRQITKLICGISRYVSGKHPDLNQLTKFNV